MAKAKFCPVCGNPMLISSKLAGGAWQGWCFVCGATGPICETSAEALEAGGDENPDESKEARAVGTA